MNDGLTPAEHDEIRASVMAGARTIRPMGPRRMAWVGGAVAAVLVVGVAGGSVAASRLLGAEGPAPAVTTPAASATPTVAPVPTPVPSTPEPTPEPSADDSSALPVVAFSGSCANALSDAEAVAAAGGDVTPRVPPWDWGTATLLGGLSCYWASPEVYMESIVNLWAYPAELVPSDTVALTATGCETTADQSRAICDASGVVDGTWLLVRSTGPTSLVGLAQTQRAYEQAAERLAASDPPKAASAQPDWWQPQSCETLISGLPPSEGGEEVRSVRDPSEQEAADANPHPVNVASRVGDDWSCSFSFPAGAPYAPATSNVVDVHVIPGGALTYPSVEATTDARPVEVEGAVSARWVPGWDPFEGAWEVLVVTDGVNTMLLSAGPAEPEELTPIAEVLLPALQ